MRVKNCVTKYLVDQGFALTLDRGQTYDSTKNMSGEYEGLQAHIQKLMMLNCLYHAEDIFFNLCSVA